MNEVSKRIQEVCAANVDPKSRVKALKSIKWRLVSRQLGLWAGLSGLDIVPVSSPAGAQTFDGRDNETTRAQFFTAATGIVWTPELCES